MFHSTFYIKNMHLERSVRLVIGLLLVFQLILIIIITPTITRAAELPQLLYIDSDSSLNIANSDGSGVRRIAGNVADSRWSPDGSKIVYLEGSETYQTTGIVVVNADGSNLHRLNGSNPHNPSWSPDSRKLAYATGTSIVLVDADGSNSKTFNVGSSFTPIKWSPDGKFFIFSVCCDTVYRANVDGTFPGKQFNFEGDFEGFWIDGQRLLINEADPNEQGMAARGNLAIVRLDGSDKQYLNIKEIRTGYDIKHISLSPDGSKIIIAYSTLVDSKNPTSGKELNNDTSFIHVADWNVNTGKLLALISTYDQQANKSNLDLVEINPLTLQRRTIVSNIPVTEIGTDAALPYINFSIEQNGSVLFSDLTGTTFVVDSKSNKLISFPGKRLNETASWRPNSGSTTYGNILPDFYNVWKQSDLAVANGQSKSSWLWGPDAFATKTEDYKEAPGGKRQVQYFDKARMEITNPNGDRSNLYFITNGLLPKELISGQMQVGDNSFIKKSPAEVNVAGDAGGSVTYAKLAGVTTLEIGKNTASNRIGQPVTAAIDRNGTVSQREALAGVQLATYIPETQHNIPNVFWDYFKTLPQDWLFVMGYPLSEPYITEITLAGKPTLAMVQVFERRVLTYTPSNPVPYKVEQGNVGRHYYQWRYGN